MTSGRYVPILCVLVALALVPTIIHSYATDAEADGRTASSIPLALAGYQGVPTDRNATWGQRRFNSDDWIEREYTNGSRGHRLILTVVRTYDAKSVYHHPELAVTYRRATFVNETVERVGENGVPVHVLKTLDGREGSALYLLHYDSRFIDNPIAFQIRTAAELLFSRRKPMTLLFVFDPGNPGSGQIDGSPALTLALAAANALGAAAEPARE